MVKVIFTDNFEKTFRKIKDKLNKERIIKQIKKIKENSEVGKSLKYYRGERSIYVKLFRLVYALRNNILYLLKFEHRKSVYK